MQVQSIAHSSSAAPAATRHLRFAIGGSALGPFIVAVSGRGIAAVLFGAGRDALLADLRQRLGALCREDAGGLADAVADFAALIVSPGRPCALTLDPAGTEFQLGVWRALQAIPAGRTASYADIAVRIGNAKAVRAVARACAANPIAIAIPCHRVVRGDGSLGGYRWGVRRKALLLQAEAAL